MKKKKKISEEKHYFPKLVFFGLFSESYATFGGYYDSGECQFR